LRNHGLMFKIIFLVPLSLVSIFSSGQDGLFIKNKKNGKAWMYEKGSTVTYIKFHEDEYTTGILNALLDTSAVVIGEDTVLLSDIAGIRKKAPVHTLTRIIGMPLMLFGSLAMADGAASIYSHPESDAGVKFFLLGAGIFAVGYLPYQLSLQDLDVGYRGVWAVKIYRARPLTQ